MLQNTKKRRIVVGPTPAAAVDDTLAPTDLAIKSLVFSRLSRDFMHALLNKKMRDAEK